MTAPNFTTANPAATSGASSFFSRSRTVGSGTGGYGEGTCSGVVTPSGWQQNARVECAGRVERVLHRAHGGDLLGRAGQREPVDLRPADPVLAADRALKRCDQPQDGVGDVLGE